MVAVVDKSQAFYVGIYPPTGDYEFLDNQPAVDGVTLTKNTTKADLDLDKVFQYRGQVASYNKLPKNAHIGDTYNVQDTGENYAWNGSSWDLLTGTEAVYWRSGKLESQGSALTIDSNKNTITNLTLDDITDVTATVAEVNYVDGVTSPIQTQLDGKIDKFSTMPEVSKEYANKIVQYVGDTNANYTNGYFYKCAETGSIPDSVTFTPKAGVSTVVSVSPADFVAFITPWCEGRPFGPSDVTHGGIGIYSGSQYAMTIETDGDEFAHGVFTIAELQEAGFTFTPPFGAQQGATYVCSIGQKTYAWQRVNVQPETDISGKQDVIDSSHMLSSDLVDDTNKTHLFVTSTEKQTWNDKQTTSNLVTSLSSLSTDIQYPSAKCVYDLIGDIESALNTINSGS